MTNDRRLLLALLTQNFRTEFNIGHTRGECQVPISCHPGLHDGPYVYEMRVCGHVQGFATLGSLEETLVAMEVI